MKKFYCPHQFVRVHKSHLINARHVRGYNALNSNVIMNDGSSIEVSRRRKREALEGLGIKN